MSKTICAQLNTRPTIRADSSTTRRSFSDKLCLRSSFKWMIPCSMLEDSTACEYWQSLDNRQSLIFIQGAFVSQVTGCVGALQHQGGLNSGQGFFFKGLDGQALLGTEAFHIEHGADFLDLAAGCEGPERHGRNAQYLVAGRVTEGRFFDGADQGAPGHHLVTFGNALLDHYLQVGHG